MQITVQQLAIIMGGGGAVTYVTTAIVSTMPPKDAEWSKRTIYGWLFDCAHMLINSRPTKDAAK